MAVLGVGEMGSFHVGRLARRTRGARVTVVSDFSADEAAEVGDPIGARVVADPSAAIAADDVDAVVLASPGAAHEAQVLACLEAGKPVLCEKPLTTDEASSYALRPGARPRSAAADPGRLHAPLRPRVRGAAAT